jgi:hypothetical protein
MDRLKGYIRANYGGPHEPLYYGTTIRYDPATMEAKPWLPLPIHDLGAVTAPNAPHEASPTGKPGVGYLTASIPPQLIANARPRTVWGLDRRPVYAGESALVTTSLINPWDLISAKRSKRTGTADPGSKWMG